MPQPETARAVETALGPVEVPALGRTLMHDVLPYLREHGVSDAQIEEMLAGNPARILAGRLPNAED